MTATDPVSLIAIALSEPDPEEKAAALEGILRAHMWACHQAEPGMPLEEINLLFGGLVRAALAQLANDEKATAPRPLLH